MLFFQRAVEKEVSTDGQIDDLLQSIQEVLTKKELSLTQRYKGSIFFMKNNAFF